MAEIHQIQRTLLSSAMDITLRTERCKLVHMVKCEGMKSHHTTRSPNSKSSLRPKSGKLSQWELKAGRRCKGRVMHLTPQVTMGSKLVGVHPVNGMITHYC